MNTDESALAQFQERAAELVSRMTLEEKISQVSSNSSPIPRLGVPYYGYWSEASHGYFGPFRAINMDVTSYPVCLAMSQSWDRDKIKRVTTAISDEIRAHHNLNGVELHMWCPTINLARDPRNGRSDENFGEDPFLAGKMAASYIQGMQGDDPAYLKVVSTPKHYALNSSENNRHTGSSNVDEATLREYYARVFEYAIREGGAQSIMTSYNRVNGKPASINDTLLTTLLREEWGFTGFVVSDCGAVADCYQNPGFSRGSKLGHFYAKSLEEASAMTLLAGTDVTCGTEHKRALLHAVELGYVTEDVIDRAAIRALTTRFRLGLFDEPSKTPWGKIGRERVCADDQKALSLDMACDTIVLLKNDDALLPLDKAGLKSILVVGPNALYRQLGGYSAGGTPLIDTVVNVMALDGIRAEAAGVEVKYEKGWCSGVETRTGGPMDLPGADMADMFLSLDVMPPEMDRAAIQKHLENERNTPPRYKPDDPDYQADSNALFDRALAAARQADVVVVIAGTDATNASEEHDRETLTLPYGQDEKIQKLIEANPKTVVVLTTLGAVTGRFFDKAHTVLNAHFAGQAQGAAIARVLFGAVNPNAKLTATWYRRQEDLPHVNDYGIKKQDTLDRKARTYMYFDGKVLFPFGHGLSYTTYAYANLALAKTALDANDTLRVSVDVRNTGARDGREIVQFYVSKKTPEGMLDNKPLRQLKGFAKVEIKAGETRTVSVDIPLREVTFWSNRLRRMVVEPGTYVVEAGGSSAKLPCKAEFTVSGAWNARLANVYAVADKYVYQTGAQGLVRVTATLEDTARVRIPPVFVSTNERVATVDEYGVVTARGTGTATIIAAVTLDGVTKRARVPVAVNE